MTSSSSSSPYRSLILDIAVPLALYFGLHDGAGVGLVLSLAISSIPPAVREVAGIMRDRHVNGLAALMLATNLAGIVASFVSGDARLLFAKDSLISSTIAIAILVSVWRGQPLMTEGLEPFMVKGDEARRSAWRRLRAGSVEFHRLEARYSVIWGVILLGDCAARLVGAVVLPVSTMSWASTVIVVIAVAIATLVSGLLCTARIERMIRRDVAGPSSGGPELALA